MINISLLIDCLLNFILVFWLVSISRKVSYLEGNEKSIIGFLKNERMNIYNKSSNIGDFKSDIVNMKSDISLLNDRVFKKKVTRKNKKITMADSELSFIQNLNHFANSANSKFEKNID